MTANIEFFPNPRTFDFPEFVEIGDYYYHSRDVVAFGIPLTPATVIEAYDKGIFPWFVHETPLPWYCPEQRAILEFENLRLSRSLRKLVRNNPFRFTIDEAFGSVIRECANAKRSGQTGTWITDEFVRIYSELHAQGRVHSVEAWDSGGELVGGLYGVDAGGVFCGESMFHVKPNASKLTLLFLIDHLRDRGGTWLDCQVMTEHMRALGAEEITRTAFLKKLELAQSNGSKLFEADT